MRLCCSLAIQKKLQEKSPDPVEIHNAIELAGIRICFPVFKIRAAQSEADFEILSWGQGYQLAGVGWICPAPNDLTPLCNIIKVFAFPLQSMELYKNPSPTAKALHSPACSY